MEFVLQNLDTSVIVVAIAFYIVFHYLSHNNKSRKQKLLPEAGGGCIRPPSAGGAWLTYGQMDQPSSGSESLGGQRWWTNSPLSTMFHISVSAAKRAGYNYIMAFLHLAGTEVSDEKRTACQRISEGMRKLKEKKWTLLLKNGYKSIIGRKRPQMMDLLLESSKEDFMDVMLSIERIDLNGFDADSVIKSTCMGLQEAKNIQEDCTISGFHGQIVLSCGKLNEIHKFGLALHLNQRFINSHKDLDVLGQDFELIPFGAGRRICPGITFGLQMVHLVLANLLHSFELSNVSNEGIDMTETAGLTNLKATPLEILIVPLSLIFISQPHINIRRYEELVNGREKGRGLGERRETILDRWGRTSREPTGSLLHTTDSDTKSIEARTHSHPGATRPQVQPIQTKRNSSKTFTSLVFLLFVCCYSSLAHNNKSGKQKQKSPPEAAAGWPILGHLHIFSGSKLAHVELGNMADKYGPAFTIRIGVHRALVVSDWKLVKELSTVHDVHVSSRTKFRAAEHLGYNYNRKHIRVSEIDTSIKELYKLWTENKNFGDPSGRVLVEMKKWFGDITVNVFLQMMAGKRYFRTATVSDERDGRRCKKALRDFFHYLGVFAPADALPFLGGLDIGGYEKTMKEVAKEMDSLVDDWLQEHRRKKVAVGDGSNGGEEDFIDAMLSRLEEIDRNGYNADSVIKSTCMRTPAEFDCWRSRYSNSHANVGSIFDDEQSPCVEDGSRRTRQGSWQGKNAPLGGPRMFTEDCNVSGFHVPKGTWLFFNVWKLQRDPQVWSNPHEFKPERFINSHKDLDVLGQDFELIPFGAGRRICRGTTFGLQMLHLVLANLLHSFELSNVCNYGIDMTETAGLTNLKLTPLEIRIAPRLPPHLY
nr:cytochrome P450 family 82 subfamily D polypeptide 47 [Ipomoea batatas]